MKPAVTCATAWELMSALLDGELTRDEQSMLAAHVASCAGCQQRELELATLHRRLRVRPAPEIPDLVRRVTTRSRPARHGRGQWVRWSLAWIAVVIAVQHGAALFLGRSEGVASEHAARHLGSFGIALAVGFAYAAWRPHRAFGLLPFTTTLMVTTVISTGVDVAANGYQVLSESVHLPQLIGLWLLWMLAGSPGWHPDRWLHRPHRHLPRRVEGWLSGRRSARAALPTTHR